MTIAKVRGLSQFGVITDVDPFNLPLQAYSRAVNVRFQQQSVVRAPVFRRVPLTLAETDPRFLTTNLPTSGFDTLYLGYLNGKVSSYDSGTETDVSVFGYVGSDAEQPFTSCHLGDVLYINRADRVPWSLTVSDSVFQNLAHWDTNHRAKILRAAGSALCAFGITKSGTTFPTMVKTSEFAQVNTVPSSWDETDPTTNATENILAEMEGPITDACNLGNGIVVYGYNEAWAMTPTTSNDVWNYEKLPFDTGCINVNCAVEIGGKHYVFGPNDIWVHDGISKKSICDGQTRRNIFSTINLSKANRCFVKHDPGRKELRFCYIGSDDLVGFLGTEGCNRAAVYSLTEETWTYDDLPNVFGASIANLDISLTWATATQTWDTVGGTWLDQEDSLKKTLVILGDVSSAYTLTKSLYAVDNQGPGSIISYDVDTNATLGWTLERTGMDLDDLPEAKDLRGYKVASSIFPQARLETGAEPLMFSFGSSDYYGEEIEWGTPQSFDGRIETRCDHFEAGRYLSMRITHDDYHYVNMTGYDIDFVVTGEES